MQVKSVSDARCMCELERIRWPDQIKCLRCARGDAQRLARIGNGTRRLYWCHVCKYQFSPTVNTVFHRSHISLNKWFKAIYLCASSPLDVSARELQRSLEISYDSAWQMKRKIRRAIEVEPEFCRQIADAYLDALLDEGMLPVSLHATWR